MLATVARANPQYSGGLLLGRQWLNPFRVYVIPASCQVGFATGGEIFSTREAWPGLAKPDLNALMAILSGLPRPLDGVILFSGAGEDGARGMAALAPRGTRLWSQSPQSAVAPSMPNAAQQHARLSRQGSPRELAQALLEIYR